MLLLLTVFPLFSLEVVPLEKIALKGRLASAEFVMSLLSMVFPSLPVVPVVELKNSMPPYWGVEEPLRMQYLTVFVHASLMKRMVDVELVTDELELLITRSLADPVAFTLPSMVTLSAPFRSISGVARLPEMDSPVVVG